jgi:hypothetical protein
VKRIAALVMLVAACGGGVSPASVTPTASPPVVPIATPSNRATQQPSPSPPPSPKGPLTGSWTKLEPTGDVPAAREDQTWTVDPATQTAYLFGGRDGETVFGDLFAFDLASDSWHRLQPAGATPAARFGHEAQWVDGVGLVVLAGQGSGNAFFGDLWAFDPSTNRWSALPTGGDAPVPRYGSCSGVGPDGRLWISHGFTEEGTRFFDTKAYDFEAHSWTDVTPASPRPVERCLHACWWTPDGRLALYGGQTTGVKALGDLWALEPAPLSDPHTPGTWAQAEGDLPAARALPAFTVLGDHELVFGGRSLSGEPLADAYVVGGSSLRMTALAITGDVTPNPRSAATLIADPARARVLLVGGRGDANSFADLWQLTIP